VTTTRPDSTTPRGGATGRCVPGREAFDLRPLREQIVLPPRLARRARLLAHQAGVPVGRFLACLVARFLVPSARELRRLVREDLRDALGGAAADWHRLKLAPAIEELSQRPQWVLWRAEERGRQELEGADE
jgi:hypothetical protein